MNNSHKKPFHLSLENTLIAEFNEILKREEEFWKLKFRVQWLNEGDANTKFFHTTTIDRRRKNRILGLNDSIGNWTFDKGAINNIILNHLKNIYSTELIKSHYQNPTTCKNAFSEEDKNNIGRPLTKEDEKMLFSLLNL